MSSFVGYTKAAIELCSNPKQSRLIKSAINVFCANHLCNYETFPLVKFPVEDNYLIWYNSKIFKYATICDAQTVAKVDKIVENISEVNDDKIIEYWHQHLQGLSTYGIYADYGSFGVTLYPGSIDIAENLTNHVLESYSILAHEQIRAELNKL